MLAVPTFRQIDLALEPDQGVVILIYRGAEEPECAVLARRTSADEWVENSPVSINEAVEWARDRAMMFDFDEILIKLDEPGLWEPGWGPLS